jgi:hypothetical protein
MIGAEGGTVVGVDLDQAAIEQIMDGIRRAGGKAYGLVANALAAADVARVVQQTGVARPHYRAIGCNTSTPWATSGPHAGASAI